MSKNHYEMSAIASANLEIDYLRGQLIEAKNKLKDVLEARVTDDVTENYECTQEQAQQVLDMALTNTATIEQIWNAIDDACDTLEIKSIQNQD